MRLLPVVDFVSGPKGKKQGDNAEGYAGNESTMTGCDFQFLVEIDATEWKVTQGAISLYAGGDNERLFPWIRTKKAPAALLRGTQHPAMLRLPKFDPLRCFQLQAAPMGLHGTWMITNLVLR